MNNEGIFEAVGNLFQGNNCIKYILKLHHQAGPNIDDVSNSSISIELSRLTSSSENDLSSSGSICVAD